MSSAPEAAKPSPRDQTEGALVGLGIMVFAVVLILARERWAYNFPLIEHDRYFWVTMVVVFLGTIVLTLALWHWAWRRPCKYAGVIALAMTAGAYHVFYPIANGALDQSTPKRRVYVVARRHCSPGKGERAEMVLRPDARSDSGEVTLRVSAQDCRDARDGQELVLDVMPGLFGTRWVSHYDVTGNVENEAAPD